MRAILVVALLALVATALPHAAADVTVDQDVDLPGGGGCRGTNGVSGSWGEAWFGSGGSYQGPCRLYVFIDT